ncbi:MAG: preprotein translocase subunit SecE [Bacteroidia bacterium]|nr:preprotein translocase subunit SecE [Bacteroidia bacterium]
MEKLKNYFSEYTDELLYKVQWTPSEKLISDSITVFVACIVLATIIFIMDAAFGTVLGQLYKLF